MKKLLALLLCVLMIVSCFVGCGSEPAKEPAETPATNTPATNTPAENTEKPAESGEAGEVKYQETITVGNEADFVRADLHNTSSVVDRRALRVAQDNLVEWDPVNEEVIPALATEWEKLDETTWQFTLREGVKFHDGTDFTAEDVKFTIERAMESSTASAIVATIAEVEIVDDYTVNIKLNKIDPDIIYKLTDSNGIMMSKDAFDTMDETEAPKIGTGPFKCVSWVQGSEAVFEAFDDCWEGAPKTRRIVFKYIPEASARLIALQTGEIDYVVNPAGSDIHYIEEDPNLAFHRFPGMNLSYVWFNINVKPFDNKLVRQAVSLALNPDDFVAITYQGFADPAYNVMHPATPFYDADTIKYGYDIEKAKELLAEAGYPDGFECTLYSTTSTTRKSDATIIQSSLAAIGITVNVQNQESATFNAGVAHGGTYDFAVDGWGGHAVGADRALRTVFHSEGPTNRCNIEDPKVDEMIDNALSAPTDEERAEIYSELQNYLMEEAVWAPLYIASQNIGTKAAVEGVAAPQGTTLICRYLCIPE